MLDAFTMPGIEDMHQPIARLDRRIVCRSAPQCDRERGRLPRRARLGPRLRLDVTHAPLGARRIIVDKDSASIGKRDTIES